MHSETDILIGVVILQSSRVEALAGSREIRQIDGSNIVMRVRDTRELRQLTRCSSSRARNQGTAAYLKKGHRVPYLTGKRECVHKRRCILAGEESDEKHLASIPPSTR